MNILKKITEGIPLGEMSIISAGRMTGKSYYTNHLLNSMANRVQFTIVTSAIVDDEQWHTVMISAFSSQVSKWLREQDPQLVTEISDPGRNFGIDSVFDIHDKVYTMMVLKFQ